MLDLFENLGRIYTYPSDRTGKFLLCSAIFVLVKNTQTKDSILYDPVRKITLLSVNTESDRELDDQKMVAQYV